MKPGRHDFFHQSSIRIYIIALTTLFLGLGHVDASIESQILKALGKRIDDQPAEATVLKRAGENENALDTEKITETGLDIAADSITEVSSEEEDRKPWGEVLISSAGGTVVFLVICWAVRRFCVIWAESR